VTTRSTRLGVYTSTNASAVVLFTCPTGSVTIVKSAMLSNGQTTARVAELYFYTPAISDPVQFFTLSIPVGGVSSWTGWVILNAGDQVWFNGGGDHTSVWLSGSVLPYP
jgi:hypothetical protein